MFHHTDPDRRTGSSLNRSRRTVLLPAVAVIAAMLVPALADAEPVSQSPTSTAQAAHKKKRCAKGTHRTAKHMNGKRHVHCVRNRTSGAPPAPPLPVPAPPGGSSPLVPAPAPPSTPPPVSPGGGTPPPTGSSRPGTPPPVPTSARHAKAAQDLYLWEGWGEPFTVPEYNNVTARIAQWKYLGCSNVIYRQLHWYNGSQWVYWGIQMWTDATGFNYAAPPC